MKLKNSSSAKKRCRVTGSGKLVHRKACRGHLLLQKKRTAKKAANKPQMLTGGDLRRVARLLPYR